MDYSFARNYPYFCDIWLALSFNLVVGSPLEKRQRHRQTPIKYTCDYRSTSSIREANPHTMARIDYPDYFYFNAVRGSRGQIHGKGIQCRGLGYDAHDIYNMDRVLRDLSSEALDEQINTK